MKKKGKAERYGEKRAPARAHWKDEKAQREKASRANPRKDQIRPERDRQKVGETNAKAQVGPTRARRGIWEEDQRFEQVGGHEKASDWAVRGGPNQESAREKVPGRVEKGGSQWKRSQVSFFSFLLFNEYFNG